MIETKRLTRDYGRLRAVDGVSLSVQEGEVYGFLGLNGAGKTTTIRMLLGLVRPTSGTAHISGVPVSADAVGLWSSVGHLVESTHAYPELTVRENLEVFRRLRSIPDRSCIQQIMQQLYLEPYADRKARHLSLGNAQRLGLAKAMMHRPRVLILDEPSNGLDPAGIVQIRTLLQDMAANDGTTVFVSSHILGEISKVAQRIGIIHEGRLMREARASELERERTRILLIRTPDSRTALSVLSTARVKSVAIINEQIEIRDDDAIAHPESIARLLVNEGIPLTHLAVEQEDLETYFLRLVGRKNGGTV